METADVSRQFIQSFLTHRPVAELAIDLRSPMIKSFSVGCGQLTQGSHPSRMMPAVPQSRALSLGRCQQLITSVRSSGMQGITVVGAVTHQVAFAGSLGQLRNKNFGRDTRFADVERPHLPRVWGRRISPNGMQLVAESITTHSPTPAGVRVLPKGVTGHRPATHLATQAAFDAVHGRGARLSLHPAQDRGEQPLSPQNPPPSA